MSPALADGGRDASGPARGLRRCWALWSAQAGVALSMVVALAVGAQAGSFVLAALLAGFAAIRGLVPEPGPTGISTRSKRVDVVTLAATAGAVAVLAATAPGL